MGVDQAASRAGLRSSLNAIPLKKALPVMEGSIEQSQARMLPTSIVHEHPTPRNKTNLACNPWIIELIHPEVFRTRSEPL